MTVPVMFLTELAYKAQAENKKKKKMIQFLSVILPGIIGLSMGKRIHDNIDAHRNSFPLFLLVILITVPAAVEVRGTEEYCNALADEDAYGVVPASEDVRDTASKIINVMKYFMVKRYMSNGSATEHFLEDFAGTLIEEVSTNSKSTVIHQKKAPLKQILL